MAMLEALRYHCLTRTGASRHEGYEVMLRLELLLGAPWSEVWGPLVTGRIKQLHVGSIEQGREQVLDYLVNLTPLRLETLVEYLDGIYHPSVQQELEVFESCLARLSAPHGPASSSSAPLPTTAPVLPLPNLPFPAQRYSALAFNPRERERIRESHARTFLNMEAEWARAVRAIDPVRRAEQLLRRYTNPWRLRHLWRVVLRKDRRGCPLENHLHAIEDSELAGSILDKYLDLRTTSRERTIRRRELFDVTIDRRIKAKSAAHTQALQSTSWDKYLVLGPQGQLRRRHVMRPREGMHDRVRAAAGRVGEQQGDEDDLEELRQQIWEDHYDHLLGLAVPEPVVIFGDIQFQYTEHDGEDLFGCI